jgi:hypothetical protein
MTVSLMVLSLNLSKPSGYVMHHQFNIQQFYILPTLYLRVFYSSENKQRFLPLRHKMVCFLTEMKVFTARCVLGL